MSPLALGLLIFVCLLFSAFFSGIETGIISIHRMRLKHFVREGDPSAKLLQAYLDNPDRLLGTTLLGNNICNVTIAVASANMAARMLLAGAWWPYVFSSVAAVVSLIVAEYIPKAWFHAKPYQRSRVFVRYLQAAELILSPMLRVLAFITHRVLPGGKSADAVLVPFVTREDLKILMREGEEHGVLSTEERRRIQRVFDLPRKRVQDIMIPVADITQVNAGMSIAGFLEVERRAPFSRMPVQNDTTGRLEGIINLFSAMSVPDEEQTIRTVGELARPAFTVSELLPADEVYVLMRRQRQPMVLVVNTQKDVVGLITDEDVLEEIVGKISWVHPVRR